MEHAHTFDDIGVKITRYYPSSPDEAGSLTRIRQEIDEMRKHLPGFEPWNGLHIIMAHEDAPEFDETELEKYRAAGLTYGSQELVVIRYKPTSETDNIIRVLCHELGHWVASQSHINTRTAWGRLAIDYFKSIMPMGQFGDDSWVEGFAECWASINGTDEFRGRFSDGVIYRPPASMTSFIKAVYHASQKADLNYVDRLWADSGGLAWREKRVIEVKKEWWHWWMTKEEIKIWQRVTPELKLQDWNGGWG